MAFSLDTILTGGLRTHKVFFKCVKLNIHNL